MISQTGASDGAEAHKDFEVYDSGKVELEYRLTTGGVKVDGSNWNWTGHEYTMGMKLLDSDNLRGKTQIDSQVRIDDANSYILRYRFVLFEKVLLFIFVCISVILIY